MKINAKTRQLLEYRQLGLTLNQAIILELVKQQPRYVAELREVLDMDNGSLNKALNRMIAEGFLVKEHRPAKSRWQGPPLSALVLPGPRVV